jgi:transcriptional regulator with XRE-family HTH domain
MAETFDEAVGKNVAALRQGRGWSQSDLADRVNERGETFRQQTILKIEKGSRPMKLSEALNIAAALETSPFALWHGSQSERSGQIARQMSVVFARADDLRQAVANLYPDLVRLAYLLAQHRDGVDPFVAETAMDFVESDWGFEVNEQLAEELRKEFGELPDGYTISDLASPTDG